MEHIRLADQHDLAALKQLTDENFGVDYYTDDYIRQVLTDPQKNVFVYTDENDVPVAYTYMFVSPFARVREILKIPASVPGWEMPDEDAPVGVYKSSCTDKKYRGRGIFKLLVQAAEVYFIEHNIQVLMGNAIRHPSGYVPIAVSVEKSGFRAIAEIKHPWSDIDSYCPYCQSRYCQCDAILYLKEFD